MRPHRESHQRDAVDRESRECVGESSDVSHGHGQSVRVVLDQLGNAAFDGADHRDAPLAHRLEQREGEPFERRRKEEDIRARKQLLHEIVGHSAHEPDPSVDEMPGGGPQEVALVGGEAAENPNPVLAVIERGIPAAQLQGAVTARLPWAQVKFLAPFSAFLRNPFAVGKNYHEHALEFDKSGFNATSGGASAIPAYPQIFTKATCVACHTVKETEAQKGPYLGNIAQTYKRPDLAQNILDPNKTIAQGFASEMITLKDGTSQMGFITLEGANEVKLRNIASQEFTFKTADIKERQKLPMSMMPPGLLYMLKEDDILDLIQHGRVTQDDHCLDPPCRRVRRPPSSPCRRASSPSCRWPCCWPTQP